MATIATIATLTLADLKRPHLTAARLLPSPFPRSACKCRQGGAFVRASFALRWRRTHFYSLPISLCAQVQKSLKTHHRRFGDMPTMKRPAARPRRTPRKRHRRPQDAFWRLWRIAITPAPQTRQRAKEKPRRAGRGWAALFVDIFSYHTKQPARCQTSCGRGVIWYIIRVRGVVDVYTGKERQRAKRDKDRRIYGKETRNGLFHCFIPLRISLYIPRSA